LGYHVLPKDDRTGWQRKQKVPKYPKFSRRNIDVDGVEVKADFIMKVKNILATIYICTEL